MKWIKWMISAGLLIAFGLWTLAVCTMDVQPIGPRGTAVGLAEMNQWAHELTGVHLSFYVLTDWMGLIPVAVGAGFGVLGLCQWIGRKSIRKVDADILLLGGFYLALLAAYLLFEKWVVNYRPVLLDGHLEASYPSSTTLLTLFVMGTAVMQCNARIGHTMLKRCLTLGIAALTAFIVLGRLYSGVHWLSDIIGGMLLSAAMVSLYGAFLPDRNGDKG